MMPGGRLSRMKAAGLMAWPQALVTTTWYWALVTAGDETSATVNEQLVAPAMGTPLDSH
jgi:hypothetical protein